VIRRRQKSSLGAAGFLSPRIRGVGQSLFHPVHVNIENVDEKNVLRSNQAISCVIAVCNCEAPCQSLQVVAAVPAAVAIVPEESHRTPQCCVGPILTLDIGPGLEPNAFLSRGVLLF
jgi:hypothetical protein